MKKHFKILSLIIMITMIVQFVPTTVRASGNPPMIGEIRLFAGNFAPAGWALCNGQTMNISEYGTLFSLIGTTYGGDGQTTFKLPDLNGRVPIGAGAGPGLTPRALGVTGGESEVTLSPNQIPTHAHQVVNLKVEVAGGGSVKADNTMGSSAVPGTNVLAKGNRNERVYSNAAAAAQISMKSGAIEFNKTYNVSNTLENTGGNQAHNNMAPSLSMNYIISLFGIFPSNGEASGEGVMGEIKMMASSVVPKNYAACAGQLLPINQNQALFALLGTMYGGNGSTTFQLPNLQGRAPLGAGTGPGLSPRTQGEIGGQENVQLSVPNLPSHVHGMSAITNNYTETAAINYSSGAGNTAVPENNALAKGTKNERIYSNTSSASMKGDGVAMTWTGAAHGSSGDGSPILTGSAGGSQAHNNMMPFLGINYIICMSGIFPSRDGNTAANDPFLGEVDMFAFDFAPGGYASCSGQLLPLSQNTALFSLLGTYYGGNGINTFGLPDLQGRFAIGAGAQYNIGQPLGSETVQLYSTQIPSHTHSLSYATTITGSGTMRATNEKGNTNTPVNNLLAKGFKNERIYSTNNPTQKLLNSVNLSFSVKTSPTDPNGNAIDQGATVASGNSLPHENMKPFLAITFAIATSGIFPPRN